MSQRNNDNNECSNANQDYHGILVNLLARLNTQEFGDILAAAFVRENQNAAANMPLPSNSIQSQPKPQPPRQRQPQPQPTVLVSRLKAKLKRRARFDDEAAGAKTVDGELNVDGNRAVE